MREVERAAAAAAQQVREVLDEQRERSAAPVLDVSDKFTELVRMSLLHGWADDSRDGTAGK